MFDELFPVPPVSAVSAGAPLQVVMMNGNRIQVQFRPNMLTNEIKVAIEAQTKIPCRYQRVLFQDTEIKGKNPVPAESVGITGGSVLQLMTVYNENAGKVGSGGAAQLDKFGNALGSNFDLGVDGAFVGMTITVLHQYSFDFALPTAAMKKKGFSVERFTSTPSVEQLEAALAKSCQLWLVSTGTPQINSGHVQAIKRFYENGRGLFIWGDNDPFYYDANVVSSTIWGIKMSGNLYGNECVGPSNSGAGFREHFVMTGISKLYEGITIATIDSHPKFRDVMRGSANNLVTSAYDEGGRRALIDGGFTRLYCNWDTAGTERFVINCAVWLANLDQDW
eukprot:c19130_g2_i2.p1 GENE.c19130_g2_i2~~c19130_g2_i2.p1  ORF type:complete len:336 (+),score=60.71 c19130_g2_i2:425-1432(+)